MDQPGKERAARLLRDAATARGMSPLEVAVLTGIDSGTVNDFWTAKRWPRVGTRKALEDTLGLAAGDFERAARGEGGTDLDTDIDPVAVAIERSGLTRANRAKLLGYYYELADSEERGAG